VRQVAKNAKRRIQARIHAEGRPKSRFVRRLGRRDQQVDWVKPKRRPWWMTGEHFALLPDPRAVQALDPRAD